MIFISYCEMITDISVIEIAKAISRYHQSVEFNLNLEYSLKLKYFLSSCCNQITDNSLIDITKALSGYQDLY